MFKAHSLQLWQERSLPPHMRDHFLTEEMIGKMLEDVGLTPIEMVRKDFLVVAFRR